MQFQEFPKIARWYREVVISEKIDGTNASIWIEDAVVSAHVITNDSLIVEIPATADKPDGWLYRVRAGSRTRFVVPGADNFGFARWVYDNARRLAALGVGTHHGEWWGKGIQRGYGMAEKRFSLFNTGRWSHDPEGEQEELPLVPGLDVVPMLYRGPLVMKNGQDPVSEALRRLSYAGSIAAPGYKNPEGVVVWHEAGRVSFKATLDGDEHKGPR